MKTRLIRILGTFLSVFGINATTNVAVGADNVCYNPTKRSYKSDYTTNDIVTYTTDTGDAWFVGWPNPDYAGDADTGLWRNAGFDHVLVFNGNKYRGVTMEPQNAYHKMPELSGYCALAVSTGYSMPDIMSGIKGAYNACVMGDDGITLYAAETGVFNYFGCCYSGNITIGTGSGSSGYVLLKECPCIFRQADSNAQYSSSLYGNITVHPVIPEIRTYEFINCSPGYYQPVDSNGFSTSVYSGQTGKISFNIHPGFLPWGSVSDEYDWFRADPCVIPAIQSDSMSYCSKAGCSVVENGWFGGYRIGNCTACPNSSTDIPSYTGTLNAKLVFADTVGRQDGSSSSGYSGSTASGIYALISTVGINSCKLASYEVTDSNGTIEYSCNSTYK